MVKICRIYLENYKLFSSKEISFGKNVLSIFDGPNGYGKTSVFDAIELLITGKMSRIIECESVKGTTAYNTVFFAKDDTKNVLFKGEFVDGEENTFVLGAQLVKGKLKGRQLNPKSIFDEVEYFLLPEYETAVVDWEQYNCTNRINEIRKKYFGEQDVNEYTLFHYIKQEDRLSYFKQDESKRSEKIDEVLGVKEEKERLDKVKNKYKIVQSKIKSLDQQINEKEQILRSKPEEASEQVEYKKILSGDCPWDRENVAFSGERDSQLHQYHEEIDSLESYVDNNYYHTLNKAIQKFKMIDKEMQRNILSAQIMKANNVFNEEEAFALLSKYSSLNKQKELILKKNFLQIDVDRLTEDIVLEKEIKESIRKQVSELNEISKRQSTIQSTINNLLKIRTELKDEHSKIKDDSGVCPYCGYDWQRRNELERSFEQTQNSMRNMLLDDGDIYVTKLEQLEYLLNTNVINLIDNRMREISGNIAYGIACTAVDKKQFVLNMANSDDIFKMIWTKDKEDENDTSHEEKVETLVKEIESKEKTIPISYIEAESKYHFDIVKKKLGLSESLNISKEDITNKRKYVNSQYYLSYLTIKEELDELTKQREILETIKGQLSAYKEAISNAIDSYKKQLIDEIEIPFFVYSSRLLQSYQGGQGVLMENDGGAIRFRAPESEHDVLYTMSSGQMSAILMAFSLAMNKIYTGDGLKTIFIDDPIQCMDDINMISFVELLHREFAEYQIVLSTHEEDFSNYIKYKYLKFGSKANSITLKNA